jgi:adenylate kinase family enzyme
MQRVAVNASAPGSGKTTLGREIARRAGLPFVELDALVYREDWGEVTDEELRATVEPIVRSERWVVEGGYERKLGDMVLRSADLVVWLDLPLPVSLWRLSRRTIRRIATHERLWGGNRETVLGTVIGRNSIFMLALRLHRERRRTWPDKLAGYPVVRLRSQAEVKAFVAGLGSDLRSGGSEL